LRRWREQGLVPGARVLVRSYQELDDLFEIQVDDGLFQDGQGRLIETQELFQAPRALAGANAPVPPESPRPRAPVRIEVLNGSGEPGAAAKLASYLRDGGFNVVSVGSADRYDYLRTLVVARTEDDRPAREVTRYLGDVDRVTQRSRSEADVTVVVGKDRGRTPWGEGKGPNDRG